MISLRSRANSPRGRATATNTRAASPMRTATVPAAPTSSNSVLAIAAPAWTEAIPATTRSGAGSAARLVDRLAVSGERDVDVPACGVGVRADHVGGGHELLDDLAVLDRRQRD